MKKTRFVFANKDHFIFCLSDWLGFPKVWTYRTVLGRFDMIFPEFTHEEQQEILQTLYDRIGRRLERVKNS